MQFEELYANYWDKIYRLCLGYINNPDQAKDLAQETFIAAWKQLDNFRHEASIGTWLYRIASNTCLRQIQIDMRMPKVDFPVQFPEPEVQSIEQEIQLLYRFISELPELDRIIISLELEGIKQADIAEVVGIKEGNVRVKIHRIKEKLTQKFKSHGK
ncbi:sigma-70 family RNA polymerase sigma factor [Sphingobacterium kyonggiense]|uniref:Sigma-70 family RNA polymerase sigma factor n=1 Tax=Sphingobacterium kyonggiense TaxID=714075 RepID=A0ABP7YMI2_9SPHI